MSEGLFCQKPFLLPTPTTFFVSIQDLDFLITTLFEDEAAAVTYGQRNFFLIASRHFTEWQ